MPQLTHRLAYAITPTITYVDGVAAPTPTDYANRGFGKLLTDIAARTPGHQATILFDRAAADALALPTDPEHISESMDFHPCAEDARAHGWKVSKIGDWTTLRADGRPLLRVGIESLLTDDRWPFTGSSLADTSAHLATWARRTGSAYFGTPGMAGVAVLSDCYPLRGKGIHPAWRPKTGPGPDPQHATEDDYRPEYWRGPRSGSLWAHGFDANRAYIAAAQSVRVCPYGLRRTGRAEWTRDRAGWWLVQLPDWPHRHMPDPAGYGPVEQTSAGHRLRWLTNPTMELLHQLSEAGWCQPPIVVDSWTGPAKELLRPWAATMRTAWDACEPCADLKAMFVDDSALCLDCQVVKAAGRQTLGLLDSPTSWVYRPDWWHSIVSMARANLWRRAWRLGGGRPDGPGPWPLWIEVDNLWYGSDLEDPRVAWPGDADKEIGPKLGQVKPKASKRRRRITQ